jgi:hypothetical protein
VGRDCIAQAPEIPWHKRPEIALVTDGVEADVLGDGLDEITVPDKEAVLATYPRIDFRRRIVHAFADGFAYKRAYSCGIVLDITQGETGGIMCTPLQA